MNNDKDASHIHTYNTHNLHVDHILCQTRLEFNNCIDIKLFVVIPNDPECWVHDDPDGSSVTQLSGRLAISHQQKQLMHWENHHKHFLPRTFDPYNIFTHMVPVKIILQVVVIDLSVLCEVIQEFSWPPCSTHYSICQSEEYLVLMSGTHIKMQSIIVRDEL